MKFLLLSTCLLINISIFSQDAYWQQELRYDISVTLNDSEKSIRGFETIVYKNNSPSSLNFIWFHLWPNAYKNDSTALMQQIRKDADRAKKLEVAGRGFIDGLDFKVNGRSARTSPHPNPNYIDVIKLNLDKPLAPGDSISISTPFNVKLPPYFSRSGYADEEFMICQWYPKPAVFNKNGWNEMPYLDMGEFFSEFASYNVKITLPAAYVVGATGTLETKAELDLYKKLGAKNYSDRKGKPEFYEAPDKIPQKTLSYKASQVHDFAWFADKKFVIQYDTVLLPGGKIIDAFSYYHYKKNTNWENSLDYTEEAVRRYSGWVGEYGYPVVQVVEGPKNNSSGGMEYPMITLITSPDAKEETLDVVISHEVGHNWFMGMLASNERAHTWMDEGMNTYFQYRYEAEKYKSNGLFGNDIPKHIRSLSVPEFQKAVYEVMGKSLPLEAAFAQPADKFVTSQEYGLISYIKPAVWMYMLETTVGRDKVDKAFQTYFIKWKFRHPEPLDMQRAFEEALGGKLDRFFKLTEKTGSLD